MACTTAPSERCSSRMMVAASCLMAGPPFLRARSSDLQRAAVAMQWQRLQARALARAFEAIPVIHAEHRGVVRAHQYFAVEDMEQVGLEVERKEVVRAAVAVSPHRFSPAQEQHAEGVFAFAEGELPGAALRNLLHLAQRSAGRRGEGQGSPIAHAAFAALLGARPK